MLAFRKGTWLSKPKLNGNDVTEISSRLTREILVTASKLSANKGRCSDGIKIQGDGFIISDRERSDLIGADEKNSEVIWPYITGVDITQNLGSLPSAWIVRFGTMAERDARRYEEPFALLESRVKPYRDALTGQIHERDFWKYWDKREKFFDSVSSFNRILACPSTAKYLIVTFVKMGWIPSHSIKLFAFDDFSSFSVLQSTIHETWARFQSGKLEQRLAYNLTKSFGTFAWPEVLPDGGAGEKLWSLREQQSLQSALCFTDLYNEIHRKDCRTTPIADLRSLIVENDREVLEAYGWGDISPDHDFHAVTYLPESDRIRFTISEKARVEILSRLTILNQERREAEVLGTSSRPTTTKNVGINASGDLFSRKEGAE